MPTLRIKELFKRLIFHLDKSLGKNSHSVKNTVAPKKRRIAGRRGSNIKSFD